MKMSGIYIYFEMRLQEIGIFVEGVSFVWLNRAWILYIDLFLISLSCCHRVEPVYNDIG